MRDAISAGGEDSAQAQTHQILGGVKVGGENGTGGAEALDIVGPHGLTEEPALDLLQSDQLQLRAHAREEGRVRGGVGHEHLDRVELV